MTQLTLGEMINKLKTFPDDTRICFGYPHSYRGNYCDLAFEDSDDREMSVKELIQICYDECVDKEFNGYKGDEMWLMTLKTPVWVSIYGCLRMENRLLDFEIFKNKISVIKSQGSIYERC